MRPKETEAQLLAAEMGAQAHTRFAVAAPPEIQYVRSGRFVPVVDRQHIHSSILSHWYAQTLRTGLHRVPRSYNFSPFQKGPSSDERPCLAQTHLRRAEW
jgi:hypothetical protein